MRFASRALAGISALVVGLGACSDDGTEPNDEVTAPTGVTATAVSPVAARVTWTAVSGATGYVLERAEGATGGTFAFVATPTGTTYDDTGLTPETTYRYRVKTISGSQNSNFSSEASVTLAALEFVSVTQDITSNTTWTADKKYRLEGFIHVQNGATLTIEPGTVIEGSFDVVGSSLFVTRGARIIANGTAAQPIVFTSSRPVGQRQAGDWGGLILLGNGIINRAAPVILEGTGTPAATNPQIDYAGGTNNADDSGILRYVRVEFAGYATAPDQELNSFTFAAIGSGTQMDHLESLNGLDDAFEFFGGAVDGKFLVSYNSGDDHFDMSEGYVGRLQFVIAYQNVAVVPRPQAGTPSSDPQGIENDGCAGTNCTNGQNSLPLTIPLVANFTLVGPPTGVNETGSGLVGMMLRRGTGGYYMNGVVTRWGRAAISLRDQTTLDRVTNGDLVLRNIHVAETGATFQAASGSTVQGDVDLTANAIEVAAGSTAAALFTALPAAPTSTPQLDWMPAASAAIRTGGLTTFPTAVATKAGAFVTGTAYRGAVDPAGARWWEGWTNYAVN
jgi:hypothetical protein